MELSVKAAVNPTEDPNKVKAAVLNLVDMELTMVEENGQSYVVGGQPLPFLAVAA